MTENEPQEGPKIETKTTKNLHQKRHGFERCKSPGASPRTLWVGGSLGQDPPPGTPRMCAYKVIDLSKKGSNIYVYMYICIYIYVYIYICIYVCVYIYIYMSLPWSCSVWTNAFSLFDFSMFLKCPIPQVLSILLFFVFFWIFAHMLKDLHPFSGPGPVLDPSVILVSF